MKLLAMILFLSIFTFFLSSCSELDPSSLSDDDLERISRHAVICDPPYIRHGTGCCLDTSGTGICDKDEVGNIVDYIPEKETDDDIKQLGPALAEDEFRERIRGGEILVLSDVQMDVRRGVYDNYHYTLRNQLDDRTAFEVFIGCNAMIGGGSLSHVRFSYILSTDYIESNDMTIQMLNVNVDPQSESALYDCAIFVATEDDAQTLIDARNSYRTANDFEKKSIIANLHNSDLYATLNFIVNVEGYKESYKLLDLPECNPPYIKYGDDCCLDTTGTGICDKDEVSDSEQDDANDKTKEIVGELLPELPDTHLEDPIVSRLENGEKLVLKEENLNLKRGDSVINYYGLINKLNYSTSFELFFGCDEAHAQGSISDITFNYASSTQYLESNDMTIQMLNVNVAPQAVITSYRCIAFAVSEENAQTLIDARNSYKTATDSEKINILNEVKNSNLYATHYFSINAVASVELT